MSAKKRFLLRIEPKLYEALELWAADEFRSVNAQIEHILYQAVRKAGRLKPTRGSTATGSEVDDEQSNTP